MARQGINTGSSPDAGDGDALLTGAIKINANFSEIYTAIGDGTNITNAIGYAVTAGIATYANSSRIVVKDSGSTVGTAGTIDFGANLSVSPISSGIVTVTASASGGTSTQWETTAAGINTLSNVGIGTTNPTSALTVIGSGASLSQLYVTGVSTFLGNASFNTATFGDSDTLDFGDSNDLRIWHDGTTNIIKNQTASSLEINLGTNSNSIFSVKNQTQTLARFYRDALVDGRVELYYNDSKKFETIGTGITVTGTTFTNQLSVSGISTFNGSNNYFNGSIICSTYAGTSRTILTGGTGGDTNLYNGGTSYSDFIFTAFQGGSSREIARINKNGVLSLPYADGGLNVVGVSTFVGNVGIGTTNASSKLTVRGGDISVGISTAHGVILTSPNGTQYRLIVDDSGTLSTVAV